MLTNHAEINWMWQHLDVFLCVFIFWTEGCGFIRAEIFLPSLRFSCKHFSFEIPQSTLADCKYTKSWKSLKLRWNVHKSANNRLNFVYFYISSFWPESCGLIRAEIFLSSLRFACKQFPLEIPQSTLAGSKYTKSWKILGMMINYTEIKTIIGQICVFLCF